jgi:nicotinate-nucleotide--dimethylbenzimidazole phosphoribosyltransferase
MRSLASLCAAITPPTADAERQARRHLDTLTKPPGSLGRLEELAARLVALTGASPRVERAVVFTLAADHGVVAEGVSAYPASVTAQMVENFVRGGAAVNVLARQAGARVIVADFGVASPMGATSSGARWGPAPQTSRAGRP